RRRRRCDRCTHHGERSTDLSRVDFGHNGLMRLALLIAGLAGCIDVSLEPCGDLSCPRGTTCDITHVRCVNPDQLTACAGMADFTPCAGGAVIGRCYDQVCLPAGCGNGIIDPGELCDDGNVTAGDGCSSDCRSLEQCGDGFNDANEQCDDGNLVDHDGCNSA